MCNSNTEESTLINLNNESAMCLGKDIACIPLEIYIGGISYSS